MDNITDSFTDDLRDNTSNFSIELDEVLNLSREIDEPEETNETTSPEVNESVNITLPVNETPINESINITSPETKETLPEEPVTNETEEPINITEPETNISPPVEEDNVTISSTLQNVTSQIRNQGILHVALESAAGIKPALASTVNGKSINTPYIKKYLGWYNNFTGISYRRLAEGKKETFTLKSKLINNDYIKGYRFDKKLYAIHLIACDRNSRGCAFRINGVPTGKLNAENDEETPNPKSEFKLDNEHSIKIKNIQWDYCGNRRFCDYTYEAYHKIEVEIE